MTTTEQRALVEAWLAAQQADPNGYISPETFYPDRLVDLVEHNEITPAVNQIETPRSSSAPPTRS